MRLAKLLLLYLLALSAPGAAVGGWRINASQVCSNAAEFVEFLRTAGPGCIRLLEFSGHGTRIYQTMDDLDDDGPFKGVLKLDGNRWLLLDQSGSEPDPHWKAKLKAALAPNAMVYFYGCQTGIYDATGLVDKSLSECIARAFSQEFQVTTVACPEFVFYPGVFPRFDGSLFSNPTLPHTEGFSTPGGIWNVFKLGEWVKPPHHGDVATFKGLRKPVVPPPLHFQPAEPRDSEQAR